MKVFIKSIYENFFDAKEMNRNDAIRISQKVDHNYIIVINFNYL